MEEAKSVARAIVSAYDWTSTPDSRKAALSFLDSIKGGDVRVLATTSFILVKKDWSSEIRLQAFKLLQHLVRLRWEELSPAERRDFANVAVGLMSEIADPCEGWALKSQTAALVAEIVRREGLVLWQELFPSLVTLSSQGPIQAELVSMMLRWLPEDITVHNEDLEGERRRLLLRGLTQSLPDILPLLYTILERHFSAALSEAAREQFEPAKQNAATVIATLNAITAYAEWAPLPDLATYGIIHGCGILLSYPDFRLHACEFFKLVSSRKRPTDAAAEFDSAISNVLQILMGVSSKFLEGSSTNQGNIEESELEFGDYVCESMVSLGSSNLQCLARDNTILTPFLQQMLQFFRHCKLALHCQSLQFWLALMREAVSKQKVQPSSSESATMTSPASCHGQAETEKERLLSFLNDDVCTVILEMSFQRLLKKEKANPETLASLGALELWSDDFEGKGEFSQYRYKLLELIRFVTLHKPIIAGVRVSERIISIIKSPHLPMPAQDLGMMESLTLALENIVNASFDGMDEFSYRNSDEQLALCSIFEGLLQQLLTLKWAEPSLVEILGHYLDAFGPFLKYFPNAVGSVVTKLFELLNSLPFSLKDPSMNNARHARLHICTSFIRIAKAADQSILPHMKGIADTMANLQREGRILRSEQNILGEALFVMASAAGIQEQQEVLAWLLKPLSHQWMQIEWQNNYLSDPSGLVQLCAETSVMWSIFHTVTFFEKALKRSGSRKGNVNLQSDPVGNSVSLHPMASHLSWMLPPLLKLLRAIHSLWSAPVYQMLPAEMKAAMTISDVERNSFLGEGPSKSAKSSMTFTDGSQAELSREGQLETKENDVRNWMKGIRDSGYNVLGLSATIGDSFFNCLDIHSLDLALMENLPSMEFRHMRQLIHSVVIPLIKYCPTGLWEVWLEKLLHPLLLHSQQALSSSWSALLHEGRAKVPDSAYVNASSDLKVEVMEEKLLRDLTREVCQLLSVMASPALNTGLPSPEQCSNRMDSASLKELDIYAESSMSSFLLKHKGLALPALQMCIEAFTWTDSDAVAKVSSFCTTVVLVAISTNNMELQDFVCRDLFSAIIRGLALESNTIISAEMIGLCREIYVYLCDRNPAPRQVLLSLPCIKPGDLLAFEEALTKTASPKEQKQHMKSLLVLATGNQLKALAAQRSINVITNMSGSMRQVGKPISTTSDPTCFGGRLKVHNQTGYPRCLVTPWKRRHDDDDDK